MFFIGSVVARECGWRLTADRVTAHLDESRTRVSRIIANGNVCIATRDQKGTATRVELDLENNRVMMSGRPRLSRPYGFAMNDRITFYLHRGSSKFVGGCPSPPLDPPEKDTPPEMMTRAPGDPGARGFWSTRAISERGTP